MNSKEISSQCSAIGFCFNRKLMASWVWIFVIKTGTVNFIQPMKNFACFEAFGILSSSLLLMIIHTKNALFIFSYFHFLITWCFSVLCPKSSICPWQFHTANFFIQWLQLKYHFILKLLPYDWRVKHLLNILKIANIKSLNELLVQLWHPWYLSQLWHCFLTLVWLVIS